MTDFIKKTVKKLKERHVTPIPRWRFVLEKLLLWVAVIAVLVLAAVALSTSFFLITQFDWSSDFFGNLGFFRFLFLSIPYFWIVLLASLILLAYLVVRKTESGYRYSWVKILLIIIGASIGMGAVAQFADIGRRTNDLAFSNIPRYYNFVRLREHQWSDPEGGLLAGEIISIGMNSINMEDLTGKEWSIKISDETFVASMAKIEKGEFIRILGNKGWASSFEAKSIMPWMKEGFYMGSRERTYDNRKGNTYEDKDYYEYGPKRLNRRGRGMMMW